jgi:hypothetical protein
MYLTNRSGLASMFCSQIIHDWSSHAVRDFYIFFRVLQLQECFIWEQNIAKPDLLALYNIFLWGMYVKYTGKNVFLWREARALRKTDVNKIWRWLAAISQNIIWLGEKWQPSKWTLKWLQRQNQGKISLLVSNSNMKRTLKLK